MTRMLDHTLQHTETAPTGQIELMDFNHIDRAVVNHIASILNRIHMPRFAQWVKRPLNERFMLGEFESPKRFLIAMSKNKIERNQLPAIYVTREPGLIFADITSSGAVDQEYAGTINNEADQPVAELETSTLSLTYVVNFVGWNDADIEPLSALYLMWLRRKANKRFTAKTLIAGAEVETRCYFSDGPLATAVPSSMSYEQEKLRSLSVSATVDVDYLLASYVNEYTVTTDFALSVMGSD